MFAICGATTSALGAGKCGGETSAFCAGKCWNGQAGSTGGVLGSCRSVELRPGALSARGGRGATALEACRVGPSSSGSAGITGTVATAAEPRAIV